MFEAVDTMLGEKVGREKEASIEGVIVGEIKWGPKRWEGHSFCSGTVTIRRGEGK
jgi:hypothetical protein